MAFSHLFGLIFKLRWTDCQGNCSDQTVNNSFVSVPVFLYTGVYLPGTV